MTHTWSHDPSFDSRPMHAGTAPLPGPRGRSPAPLRPFPPAGPRDVAKEPAWNTYTNFNADGRNRNLRASARVLPVQFAHHIFCQTSNTANQMLAISPATRSTVPSRFAKQGGSRQSATGAFAKCEAQYAHQGNTTPESQLQKRPCFCVLVELPCCIYAFQVFQRFLMLACFCEEVQCALYLLA